MLGWGIVPCYTVLSLVLLVTIIHHFSREWREEDEAVAHSYDFIIVGGGTTGAVVAARLSEEASVSVLLVEAGGDGNLLSNVPMLSTLQFNGDMDWAYKTKSDGKSCLGMVGGECNWHRGKVIGGTSVLNALIYNRGHRLDYDYWEGLGNYGWSFDDVLPYFLKSEDMKDESIMEAADGKYHSTGGPLSVERAGQHSKMATLFLEASRAMGLNITEDFSGEAQLSGVGLRHQATADGARVSSANSFLKAAVDRPNLKVLLNAQVQKVLLGGGGSNRARGILVKLRDGPTRNIFVRREVVISAGAVASPQLLMLSGIGPRRHLQELDIPGTRFNNFNLKQF